MKRLLFFVHFIRFYLLSLQNQLRKNKQQL